LAQFELQSKTENMAGSAIHAALKTRLQAGPAIYTPVLVAVAYYFGAEVAFSIGTLSDRIFAPFWPPNIVLLCALVLVPERRWWLFIAAAFPAHVLAEIGVGMPPSQYLIAFATNCMVAMLSAYGIRRLIGEPPWFINLHQAVLYVLIAVVVSPAVSALGGALVRIAGGEPFENYWTYWVQWYNANALAGATLGPVFLTWIGIDTNPSAFAGSRKLEAAALLAGLVGACLVTFGAAPDTLPSGFLPTLHYLPVPFIVWGAVRFGSVGASGTILIVTVVSIWRNLQGAASFSDDTPEENVLALQVFLTALSIPALLLGAAIEELRRAKDTMQELAGSLLRVHDEERRGVSRQLHDKVAQDLAAAHLVTARFEQEAPASRAMIAELGRALQRAMSELRTMSYHLHPPLLDEAGLDLALKSYIGELAKRSGVTVDFALSSDSARLSPDMEIVLFRVIQDAVTTVHRHSGSLRARIALTIARTGGEQKIALAIEDVGDAADTLSPARIAGPHELAGTGLAGMRERLRRIGGRVQVETALGRTIITAIVPISH
jgi:signal transduction histidine kinase